MISPNQTGIRKHENLSKFRLYQKLREKTVLSLSSTASTVPGSRIVSRASNGCKKSSSKSWNIKVRSHDGHLMRAGEAEGCSAKNRKFPISAATQLSAAPKRMLCESSFRGVTAQWICYRLQSFIYCSPRFKIQAHYLCFLIIYVVY